MMDHRRYRRVLLAEPHREDQELFAHRAKCASCRAFAADVLVFEGKLQRAVKVGIKPNAEVFRFERRGAPPKRPVPWLALAASMIIATVVAGLAWLAVPQSSLAADVVAHVADEPDAWNRHDPLPARELNPILNRAHMSLNPNALAVSYARPCAFRNQMAAHLTVQSPDGPVAVMMLTHESVSSPSHFDEAGYRGMIVPVSDHGSLAILVKAAGTATMDLDAIAARVRGAIRWSN